MNRTTLKDWTTKAGLRAIVLELSTPPPYGMRWTTGYVEVPKGHVMHGVGYSQQIEPLIEAIKGEVPVGSKGILLAVTAGVGALPNQTLRASPDVVFDVHGGLTYAGAGGKYPAEGGDGWWFGFDTNHYQDGPFEQSESYTAAECERLAEQINRMFPAALEHEERKGA